MRIVALVLCSTVLVLPVLAQVPQTPAPKPQGFKQPNKLPIFNNEPKPITPRPIAPTTPQPLPANKLVRFDYRSANLRWVNGQWEIKAGNLWLKDFGKRERDAREALNIIRKLQLTERGTIGYPAPIMEYWLSNGKAPVAFGYGFRVTPIDVASLRAEQIGDQWCVRDDQRLFFNFGSGQQEASQAVQVIRQHGFANIGYVGHPKPSMIYFLGPSNGFGGASLRLTQSASGALKNDKNMQSGPPQNQTANVNGKQSDINPALLQQAILMSNGMNQLAHPPKGNMASVRFTPHAVKLRKEGSDWKLIGGNHVLANFGADAVTAHQAKKLLAFYHCDEHCLIGRPAHFSYFLSHGKAPQGKRYDLRGRSFDPEKISAKNMQDLWYIVHGSQPLLYFGPHRADAEALADAIQKHRFDFITQLGPASDPAMTLLIKQN